MTIYLLIQSKVKDETSIPLGLFMYPVLQSADILLFKTTHLPIGEDQIPHLQLCTYMIEKFFHYYRKNIFPVPEMLASEQTIATKKRYDSYTYLFSRNDSYS